MNVLIIQQKMIGDVLISTLLCENIKKWNPSSKIDFIANTHAVPILQNNPNINKIIIFEDYFKNDKISLIKFLINQKKKKYDILIDAYGKTESILISFFTPSKIKIGFKKWYSKWVYSESITRETERFDEDLQLTIKNRIKLLIPIIGNEFNYVTLPKVYINENEKRAAKSKLKNIKSPLIMISLLGSSKLKTYPLNKMIKLLNYLVEVHKVQLILNYMRSQEKEALDLINSLKNKTLKSIVLDKSPDSLRDYISLVSLCDAIIGNEGGAINIAKSLELPNFSIFSPQINPSGWINPSPSEVGVHIMDYDKNFQNFRLTDKEIISFYNEFEFELFKEKLSNFMSRLK